jgi:hypothetical protein
MPAGQKPHILGRLWLFRLTGAALCLAVAAIHVVDQGGFPGSKTPVYVGYGYYALELIGVVTAVLLIAGAIRVGWFLAMGVAAGPFIGYMLSRGPGLPGYTSDVGNWTEPLGLASLVVEALLFALAATLFLRGTAFLRGSADRRNNNRGVLRDRLGDARYDGDPAAYRGHAGVVRGRLAGPRSRRRPTGR